MAKNSNHLTSWVESSGHIVTKRDNGTLDVSLSFEGDPGKTEQSHKDSTDISYLLNNYVQSGEQPKIPEQVFQDFSDLPDYQTCLNIVKDIDHLFNSLPIEVKSAYDQNPALFMQAVEDPAQRERLVALGVFNAPEGDPVNPPVFDPAEAENQDDATS